MTMEELSKMLDELLANPNATPEELLAALAQTRDALLALSQPAAGADGDTPQVDADQVLSLTEKMTRLDDVRKKKLKARESLTSLKGKDWTAPVNAIPTGTKSDGTATPKIEVKSRFKSKHFKSNEEAYKVGMFLRASTGDRKAAQWCDDHGVELKTMTENNEISAGILVPEEWEDAIWNLKDPNGVARKYANIVNMSSNVWRRRKVDTSVSTYFIGEGSEPTASDITFGYMGLSAKTLAHKTNLSYNLADDSIINVVDLITEEAAYALATKEDQCAFIGNGSSTYGGIMGLRYRYQQILEDGGGTWATDDDKAKLASVIVATGTTWASVTRDDISKLRGKVRQGQQGTYAYFTNPVFYYDVMLSKAYGAGGVTATEIVNGVPQERFDGYPVVFVEAMPSATAVSDIPVYFGNMQGAMNLGNLKSTTVETDKNISTQEWTVVTSERFDINVHDIGNYNATAASRTRGSLAALITQAD